MSRTMTLDEAKEQLALTIEKSFRHRGVSRQADCLVSRACRNVINACHAQHGQAWLGRINHYDGCTPGMWLYTPGHFVLSFTCDFVLPVPSEEVALLIGKYRSLPLEQAHEMSLLIDRINDAVNRAGGVVLIWS